MAHNPNTETRLIDPELVLAFVDAAKAENAEFYVEFVKVNGDTRTMLCNAKPNDSAFFVEGAEPKRSNPRLVPVVDLELADGMRRNGLDVKGAWRSFSIDRVAALYR